MSSRTRPEFPKDNPNKIDSVLKSQTETSVYENRASVSVCVSPLLSHWPLDHPVHSVLLRIGERLTAEAVAALLKKPRETKRGWIACCPAHQDRHPSLCIRAGDDAKILLHCFAGCTTQEICHALGLTVSDLFPDEGDKPKPPYRLKPTLQPLHWRDIARRLEDHAMSLWLRSESVLHAAKELKSAEWTDEERETAMQAVSRAYDDHERAGVLEAVAFEVRSRGLNKERDHGSGRSAA
jgi:hypothetical protein